MIFDPELMDKARWIIERGADKRPEIEIDRRPYLELPMPIYPPEKKKEETDDIQNWFS
jgi:hypothetical protein